MSSPSSSPKKKSFRRSPVWLKTSLLLSAMRTLKVQSLISVLGYGFIIIIIYIILLLFSSYFIITSSLSLLLLLCPSFFAFPHVADTFRAGAPTNARPGVLQCLANQEGSYAGASRLEKYACKLYGRICSIWWA